MAQSPTLVDPESLLDLLENGQDQPGNESYMPPVGRGWPAFQVEALIAYIQSNSTLSAPAPAAEGDG